MLVVGGWRVAFCWRESKHRSRHGFAKAPRHHTLFSRSQHARSATLLARATIEYISLRHYYSSSILRILQATAVEARCCSTAAATA